MYEVFTKVWHHILDLLFPRRCVRCGKEGVMLCTSCRSSIRMVPPTCVVCQKLVPALGIIPPGRTCIYCRKSSTIYAFLSPFPYEEASIRNLIHALKYNRVRVVADDLAFLLTNYLQKFSITLPSDAIMTPIPLYPARERIRGFNQSVEIGRRLAEHTGLAFEPEILKKIKHTTPQIELSEEERKHNLHDTFTVPDMSRIKNKNIVLVDDVKTTGTTLEEAARTLKQAGAKRVWAITVAH